MLSAPIPHSRQPPMTTTTIAGDVDYATYSQGYDRQRRTDPHLAA